MTGEFAEDEIEKLRRLIATNRFNKALLDYISKNGRIPDRAERDILRTTIRERLKTKKDLTIPESYYTNAKMSIEFIITNEQLDMAARLSTLSFFFFFIFRHFILGTLIVQLICFLFYGSFLSQRLFVFKLRIFNTIKLFTFFANTWQDFILQRASKLWESFS